MSFQNVLAASASLFALAGASAAAAQSATNTPNQEGTTVQEVVVTAQKRAQALSQVPIVVQAVSAQQIQDAGVRDIKDLTILTPGLVVTSTTNETVTTARIRGVGTVGDNPGLESSVGVVIDGVYRPRNGVSFGDLGDLERIEVLKGPQGTLFGKSTSAGVINVISAKPRFDFGASGELTFGNYGQRGGSASVTGPIIADKLAGRLFFAARERDGFYDVNVNAGPRTQRDDQDQDYYTIRGQLLFTPSETLDFRLIGDYSKRDEMCCIGVQRFTGSAANSRANLINATRPFSVANPANPQARTSYANRNTTQAIEDKGVSLEANWTTPLGVVTSVTAYRDWEARVGQDSDFTAADVLYRPDDGRNGVRFETVSQEVRLAGQRGRVNYLAGVFYANEELTRNDSFLYGQDYFSYFAGRVLGGAPSLIGVTPANFAAGFGINDQYRQTDETVAVFTNNTIDITRQWDVTLGLRFTHDDKDVRSFYNTTGGSCRQAQAAFGGLAAAAGVATASTVTGALCLPWENQAYDALSGVGQTKTEDQFSGTVKTSYRLTRDLMGYLSYARGYKAGGYNLDRSQSTVVTATGPTFVPNTNTHFSPERANSYEAGVKTQFFNRRLQLNATAFYQEFNQFQLNIFLGTTFVVKSMPRVISRGLDADFTYATPIDGLTMNGGVTYAETQYSNRGPNGDPDFCRPGQTGGVCGAGTALGGALNRLPGSRVSFAPLWSASYGASYERSITDRLIGRASLQLKYQSDYNTGSDLSPQKGQVDYALVNARVGIGPKNERWMVELWAQNLFNQFYNQVVFNGPLQGTETDAANIRTYDSFLGQPRTWGATLRVKY